MPSLTVFQQAVHSLHSKQLLKIRGFSEVKVEKVKEAVKKCLVYSNPLLLKEHVLIIFQPNGGGFMTSADLAVVRKRCFRISTGSRQWDSILNDGFQSASINEVYGEFRKSLHQGQRHIN